MSTAIAQDRALHGTSSSSLGLSISVAQIRCVALVVVLAAAGVTRTAHLATYGFSEDEINKVRAVEEYRHGRFGANAEHPMLMKLAMWGSVKMPERWNAVATPDRRSGDGTVIRRPVLLDVSKRRRRASRAARRHLSGNYQALRDLTVRDAAALLARAARELPGRRVWY